MLKLKRKLKHIVKQTPKIPPVQVVQTTPQTTDTNLLMKTGAIDLDRIINRANDIQSKCQDYVVNPRTFSTFIGMRDNVGIHFSDTDWEFSRFALGQFCNKLGVPAQYIQKCVKEDKASLAVENLNEWADTYDKPLFFRTYEDRIRGVLSQRYSVCDTPSILQGIENALPVNDYNIKGWFLNEEFLHMRFVSRERINIEGEDLYPGISIESSDVGKSNLSVNFFIWKKVCTNGLIVPKKFGVLFHQKHIGVSSKQFAQDLHESFDLVEPVTAKVRESIEKTADKRLESAFADEDSMSALILRVRDLCKFNEEYAKKVISLMELGVYDKTQWGLANSVTQIAQEFPIERRLELERAAGELLVA